MCQLSDKSITCDDGWVTSFRALSVLVLAGSLVAQTHSRADQFRRATALEDLGRRLFFDARLSASGRMSCATCHDPHVAYGPPNGLAVQPGGRRAVPSLRYLQSIPQFTEHYYDSESHGDESVDNGPTGGLGWDGRFDRGRAQARAPLFSPFEMANENEAALLRRARAAGYPQPFQTLLEAIEVFEQTPSAFYPYSSRYDAWLSGKGTLSERELRGFRLFTDPDKGNCARCHIATKAPNGALPQFTDYGLIALGVPRNRDLPANMPDLGLCGPDRTDFKGRAEYCGRFMTPTLRNVATRGAFFHNGVVHTLRDAVRFYVERDSRPEKWYPGRKYDDLPPEYAANVETGAPFGPKPALTDSEIDDVVAFLETLTDSDVRTK